MEKCKNNRGNNDVPLHPLTDIFYTMRQAACCFKMLDKHVVSSEHTWFGLFKWINSLFLKRSCQFSRSGRIDLSHNETRKLQFQQVCHLINLNVDIIEWYHGLWIIKRAIDDIHAIIMTQKIPFNDCLIIRDKRSSELILERFFLNNSSSCAD